MSIDISKGLYRAVLAVAATANRVITFPDRTFTVADNADVAAGAAALTAHEGDASTHLVGTIVGTTETQTLSGKAISATGTTIPAIIAPNTVSNAADVDTSGTTEATLITQTLTAPPVAGQISITAFMSFALGTTGDTFQVRLYVGGTQKALMYYMPVTNIFAPAAISCQAAVTTAAGQIIKLTVQRAGGGGMVRSIAAANGMSWVITPGAGTTA